MGDELDIPRLKEEAEIEAVVLEENAECCICLERIKCDEEFTYACERHKSCLSCAGEWLEKGDSCPECRKEFNFGTKAKEIHNRVEENQGQNQIQAEENQNRNHRPEAEEVNYIAHLRRENLDLERALPEAEQPRERAIIDIQQRENRRRKRPSGLCR